METTLSAIKPDEQRRIYWTNVSTNTKVSVGDWQEINTEAFRKGIQVVEETSNGG